TRLSSIDCAVGVVLLLFAFFWSIAYEKKVFVKSKPNMDEAKRSTSTKTPSKVASTNGHAVGVAKKAVSSTQSCPATRKPSIPRLPNKPTSQSLSSGNGFFRTSVDGSVLANYTTANDVTIQGLESATSSSPLHGVILIGIMLCSLAAFICSKLRDPCEDAFVISTKNCSMAVALYFSVVNISSCLYSFIIYFLHLVGQCDYISWSAKRKVALEIVVTFIIMFILFTALVLLLHSTVAIYYPITLVGSAFSGLAILCYGLRILLLLRETRMLNDKPPEHQSVATSVDDQSALNAMKSSLKSYSFDQQNSVKQKSSTTGSAPITPNDHHHHSSSSTGKSPSRNSVPSMVVLSFVKPRKNSNSTNSPKANETPSLSEELED
ncbi:hypothetical protein B4U79_02708, partial [Dinothrombium tinctorium]